MKNKNVSEKSFGQQLSGYKVGEPTQDNRQVNLSQSR
jgi:hypothetical protein